MPKERILAVDDEQDILELLRFNLSREGYKCHCAASGEDTLKLLITETPDLLLLDLMLPGIDGLEVTRFMKGDRGLKSIPIIMLTAKGEEADIVTGLELGADDYITKPFSPRVLIARIKAVLRRKQQESSNKVSSIQIGDVTVYPERFEVLIKGKPVNLTYTEFSILNYLIRRPGWVFTRSQIVDAVRGMDYPVTDRSVDVQIVALRKKMGSAGHNIETVRGVGYRFRD